MAKIKLRAFPTFVLRTPLFPLSALDDPERTMQQPCFREALYLASPDLYTFTGDKTEDAEEKGDAAALKYFLRACSRCTPFGLFAGCSTGRFGSSTQIAVAEPIAARRTTRLDMQYLCALIQRIERHGAVRRQLRLFPNDTLYEIAGQYRYIEYFHRGKKTEHQMASVEITPELTAVFALARDGATFDTLAGSLVDDEITREEAEAYIDELIASSLLTTELAPAIVGDDILTTLIRKLQRFGDTEYAPTLACVQERLAAIDARPPGMTQEEYAKIERLIEPLGVPYDVKFLFQADLFRPAQAQLSTGVLTDLKEYVDFVGSISGTYQNGNLQAFQQAFVQRYETEEVPLMLALDNELGLGYPYAQGSHNDVNPVIDGIVPSYGAQGGQTGGYSATDVLLLKKYIEAMKRDAEEITIDEKDFPVKMTAYTPCFRREAGSYGKDVRGLNRLHQFDKVEIVQLSLPQNSYEALDGMVAHVESIVKSLGLPYRILRLCGGDMSFTSALTYDFEVYSEAQKRWLEVSSVSNFESFQANRLKLRYRDANKKIHLAHTLNGSSLALPRIVAALLENNQTPEGIRIPEVLIPYTGFDIIK